MAGHAGVDQFALAIDLGQDARQVAAVDIAALHHLIEPGQSRRRHAYRFGFIRSLPKAHRRPPA